MPDLPKYDPTNAGNEPGDGPLRVGGQPGKKRDEKDLPSTYSPAAAAQQDAVNIMRDLHGGTHAVRAAGQAYLPKAPGEEEPDYASRLKRSVFFNATRRTVEGLTGLVFRKDPVLSEEGDDMVPEVIRDHWENIDMEGTHGDVFCRDLLADGLLTGHAGILVDYPKATGRETRAEEMALNLRPYWVPVKKENIMSWRTTKMGGAKVLVQLVLREKSWVPDGEFGEREQLRYRVLFREGSVVGFRLLEVDEKKSVTVEDEGIYFNQSEIPFVEVKTSGAKSFLESDPPLLDLGYLNIAHYQQWSDYAFAIHKTNVPFLFGAGVQRERGPDGKEKRGPITVGPNTAIFSTDSGAKLQYVSHDGSSLGSSKEALDDLKADMGTLGLAMLAPQKRSAETAEAKRLDKSTSDSALSVAARALQDAVENALQFHANYLKLESGGSVAINRDFEGLLTEATVMSAYAQLVNAGFPKRPVLEALQLGGRINEDADLDELELLWEMAREMERQMPEPEPEPVMDQAA